MNKIAVMGAGAVLLLLLLVVFSTTYTVSFNEIAVRTSLFGQSTESDVVREAGLQWKLPIVQDKTKFDSRLQVLEPPLNEISLVDGQQVVVRAYLLWRIDAEGEGPLRFDENHRSIEDASRSLTDPFVTAIAGTLSEYSFSGLLGENSRLVEAEDQILAALQNLRSEGIVPVYVGFSQFLLPERTTNAVIKRMEQTRAALAEARRFAGTAEAESIRSKATTDSDEIRTFAELRAEDIRGEAEATASDYLADMSQAQELAIFLEWLETYKATLGRNTTFVLGPDTAPFHLADPNAAVSSAGVPLPRTMAGTAEPNGVDRPEGAASMSTDPMPGQ